MHINVTCARTGSTMKIQNVSADQRLQSRWIRIVSGLLWFTVTWNILEGGSSVYFGYNNMSVSLFAFGIDSAIEVFSESIVLYHILC